MIATTRRIPLKIELNVFMVELEYESESDGVSSRVMGQQTSKW